MIKMFNLSRLRSALTRHLLVLAVHTTLKQVWCIIIIVMIIMMIIVMTMWMMMMMLRAIIDYFAGYQLGVHCTPHD